VTDPKETGKPVVPTRQPKKKTPGIFDNLRKLPERHPVEEILGLTPVEETPGATPSTPSTPPRPSTPSTAPRPSTPSAQKTRSGISPERDYTKVANSIVRVAVPAGIFGDYGSKAKEIYDYLYQQTRGAVVPKRKVRIPKDRLMRGAGIGSEVTLRKNLMRLQESLLVKETIVPGTHGGNEYEVFLPEEAGLTGATPSTPSRGSYPLSNREGVEALDPTPSTPCLSSTTATDYGQDKTLLKDQRTIDDDAALTGLNETFKQAAKEITGRELSSSESDRWRELAEVLVAELKIAAARTTVSSVTAFLAEHLRRRLWKVDKRQARAEGRELPDETMKTAPSVDAAKCPDCLGSGWHYPEGMEKGVKKCLHEKLNVSRESNQPAN
jgi:hypothetical protein